MKKDNIALPAAVIIIIGIFLFLYFITESFPATTWSEPGLPVKSLISVRLNNPGSFAVGDTIMRFDQGTFINPVAVTRDTGIMSEQLCISKGDFADNPDFVFRDKALYYEGTLPVDVRMAGVCERASELPGILQDLGIEAEIAPGVTNTMACGAECDPATNKTCCLVRLNFPR